MNNPKRILSETEHEELSGYDSIAPERGVQRKPARLILGLAIDDVAEIKKIFLS